MNKAVLIKNLVNMKYRNDISLTKHMGHCKDSINQLTDMEIIFDKKVQGLLLMSSLLDNWKTKVVSLSNSAP